MAIVQGPLVNVYVFIFCFAAGFLIAGKRPILTLSTRGLLIALLAGALGYGLTKDDSPWHAALGVATLILNLVFIGFALIDYVSWHKRKTEA